MVRVPGVLSASPTQVLAKVWRMGLGKTRAVREALRAAPHLLL
jgi:hypothetical protein